MAVGQAVGKLGQAMTFDFSLVTRRASTHLSSWLGEGICVPRRWDPAVKNCRGMGKVLPFGFVESSRSKAGPSCLMIAEQSRPERRTARGMKSVIVFGTLCAKK